MMKVTAIPFIIYCGVHRKPDWSSLRLRRMAFVNGNLTKVFRLNKKGFFRWDARKLNTPIETLILDFVRNEKPITSRALGAICIEYDPAVATRFSIGTVEGYILMGNRKGKLATEKITNRLKAHLGQINAIERSPIFTKVFLSIGNWTFRIWSEDCVESPIMWSYYYQTSLTGGCWSPTRYRESRGEPKLIFKTFLEKYLIRAIRYILGLLNV